MKLLLITIVSVFASTLAFGQAPELPRKEFTISLSESAIYLKPGESRQLTVSILRSKHYAKEKAVLGWSTSLPKDLAIQYSPAEGAIDSSVVTITAGQSAGNGTYQVVLNATLNHVKKGSILKIVVGEDTVVSKQE